jgi:3-oxoadipate enol-lactonase
MVQDMPKLHCNGIDIHYEVHGQGEPLLFIHGLGSSGQDWAWQIDAFSASHQVIVLPRTRPPCCCI